MKRGVEGYSRDAPLRRLKTSYASEVCPTTPRINAVYVMVCLLQLDWVRVEIRMENILKNRQSSHSGIILRIFVVYPGKAKPLIGRKMLLKIF
jgi:hypothetical protein